MQMAAWWSPPAPKPMLQVCTVSPCRDGGQWHLPGSAGIPGGQWVHVTCSSTSHTSMLSAPQPAVARHLHLKAGQPAQWCSQAMPALLSSFRIVNSPCCGRTCMTQLLVACHASTPLPSSCGSRLLVTVVCAGTAMPHMEPPRQQLQPDKLGTWPRWRLVLHELLGQGRGARQLAGILVSQLACAGRCKLGQHARLSLLASGVVLAGKARGSWTCGTADVMHACRWLCSCARPCRIVSQP